MLVGENQGFKVQIIFAKKFIFSPGTVQCAYYLQIEVRRGQLPLREDNIVF